MAPIPRRSHRQAAGRAQAHCTGSESKETTTASPLLCFFLLSSVLPSSFCPAVCRGGAVQCSRHQLGLWIDLTVSLTPDSKERKGKVQYTIERGKGTTITCYSLVFSLATGY
jgi:hypothetical protein